MSEKKYVVPDGMLKAVQVALGEWWKTHSSFNGDSSVDLVLEVATDWVMVNFASIKRFDFNPHDGEEGMELAADGDYLLYEDVCRMFLAPEPKVPEEVRSLLRMDIMGDWVQIHAAILEAYRRGQQARS